MGGGVMVILGNEDFLYVRSVFFRICWVFLFVGF